MNKVLIYFIYTSHSVVICNNTFWELCFIFFLLFSQSVPFLIYGWLIEGKWFSYMSMPLRLETHYISFSHVSLQFFFSVHCSISFQFSFTVPYKSVCCEIRRSTRSGDVLSCRQTITFH